MRMAGRIATGVAAAIAGGAAWLYARERTVEKPDYETIEHDGMFSVRRYKRLIVAQTLRDGDRMTALKSGFGVLADYIFAESRGGEEIAMTAPVLADARGVNWRIRFVMPTKWTRATLPPTGPDVTIDEVPARTVAAIRFAGRPGDAEMIAHEAELRHWMRKRGWAASGEAEHAFYNSPIMPAPLRRNEVLVAIIG
jgi:hypothetical protein